MALESLAIVPRWLMLLALVACSSVSARSNILLILADDLGYSDVSFTAGDEALIPTPNLDRIANQGVTLDRFYACPVCSPTRIGTMTGRWPITLGLMGSVIPPWSDRGLPPEVLTLPEILADHGYANRACIGKWHMGRAKAEYRPRAQGFTPPERWRLETD